MNKVADEKYSEKETQERLQKILQGAFSGPPTPLKDIPKRDGESRSVGRDQPPKRRRQRKKRAA
jgi:hypothetical protein